MRTPTLLDAKNAQDNTTLTLETLINGSVAELTSYQDVVRYHELSEKTVQSIDAIQLLNANLATLEDLSARFQFVMREVRYVMKA